MYNPVHALLLRVSERYGVDQFILSYGLCLLGSFGFNAVLKRLPDHKINLKCFYIICVSVFYLFGLLDLFEGCRTLLISTLFTYVVTKYYRSRFMPYLNFAFAMGHLALNHIYAQFHSLPETESIDITGSQMVLVMKLTSFAWSYYDGALASPAEFKELTQYQRSRAISKHPSLLKFLAYTLFYPSILTGPSFDFADFDSWLNCEMFKDLPESKKPKSRLYPAKKRQIPKNGRLAFLKALQGLMWLVLSVVVPVYVNVDYMLDKKQFMARSFFFRIHYMFLLGITYRLKYYAAWTISEASCISCGLGYNGYDSKTQQIKWDRVKNISIWNVEMAQSTHQCLEAWNMNTNKWLKNYVYLRVITKGKKPGFRATLFTFLTSAFWHGTRPGYYMTFATGALFQTCGRFFRRNLRPMFIAQDGKTPTKNKWVYDYICFYVIKLAFGYLVQPFVILDWKRSWEAWGMVYYYIHIGILMTFFIFKGPFAKNVVRFCKSKQPANIAISKQKAAEKEISQNSSSLGDILKAKEQFEKDEEDMGEKINLGVPDIDLTEWIDVKKDWNQFVKEYNEWKDNNGLEIEEENLAKAFKNFMKEISYVTPVGNGSIRQRKMSFSSYSPKPIKRQEDSEGS